MYMTLQYVDDSVQSVLTVVTLPTVPSDGRILITSWRLACNLVRSTGDFYPVIER